MDDEIFNLRRQLEAALLMIQRMTAVLCEHDMAIEAAQIVGIPAVEMAQAAIGNQAADYD